MTNGIQSESAASRDPTESQAFMHDYYTHREGVSERLARLEENAKGYDSQFMSRSEFWEIIGRASIGMLLPIASLLIAAAALVITLLDKLGFLGA